tara:strand:- start:2922 stop:4136 length:1215 start_codon:yes stop_codon:yes gene_type:complete
MITRFIKYTISQISFIISVFSCLKIFFLIKNKKITVYLSPEGGFGPTIFKNVLLRCLHKDDKEYLFIFGYHPGRHNFLVSSLFSKNFLWLSLSHKILPKTPINEKKKYLIFKFLHYLLSKHSQVKQIHDFNPFFCNLLNINNLPEQGKNEFGHYRAMHKFINKNEKYIDFEINYLEEVKNRANIVFGKKKCTIFLRDKGSVSKDISAIIRDTDNIDSYRQAIETGIKNGWQFFISGDEIKTPSWAQKYKSEIIFRNKTNLKKNDFNLLAGVFADCFMSSGSGPVAWKYLQPSKPFLVLDGYPISFGWYKSTVAYKIVEKKDFSTIKDIFNDKNMIVDPPLDCRFLNSNEKEMIINDFLNNAVLDKVTGLDWVDLNLDEDCLLNSGYAKISKYWVDSQKKVLQID